MFAAPTVAASTRLIILTLALCLCSCMVIRVDSGSGPPRIESEGLINGHAAIGIPAENHLIQLDVFDGTSEGAIFELSIWKLFRIELGLAGASIGVGPFSLGLGVLFYDAETPAMEHGEHPDQGTPEAAAHTETSEGDNS